jgi:hypothetical protein
MPAFLFLACLPQIEILSLVSRAERKLIEQAMLVLECLEVTGGKRRPGRPPKWLSDSRSDRPEPGQARTTSTSKNG